MQSLHRETSIILQPDGELIRAIVDPATTGRVAPEIQFDIGVLSQKVFHDSETAQTASDDSFQPTELRAGNKTISSPGTQQPRPHVCSQPDVDDELTTVSSVSPDAIPSLRKQASVVDPEQKKQLEKGWGLSYKDPNAPVPVRKEVEVSSPQQDTLERVRQLNTERAALAQHRAQAEHAKQQAEEERKEAERQAKASAKRATLEAAAARRGEDARRRQEFRQETQKMYKATKQQEEEHTPTFVRLQQQAEAKEEEERAEKKRRWEEQIASKKFWYADIQGSLEPAPSTSKTVSPSKAVSEAPTSATLSPDPSQGLIQGESSQGSLDQPSLAGASEKKAKAKREWQQSLRNSGKFQPTEAQKPQPWGLSSHSPKLQRRLKYHQTQERGCSPMGGSAGDLGFHDQEAQPEDAQPKIDLLDESLSLTDLARSLHAEQWQQHESAAALDATTAVAAMQSQQGPLVQLMQIITGQDRSALTGSAPTDRSNSALLDSALTGQGSSAGNERTALADSALADSALADSATTGLSSDLYADNGQQPEEANVEQASSAAHADADVGHDAQSTAQSSPEEATARQQRPGNASLQLDIAQSVGSQPEEAQVSKSVPEVASSSKLEAHTAQSGGAQPDAAQPSTASALSDANQQDAVQADSNQTNAVQPDADQVNAVQPDASELHAVKSEAAPPNAPVPDSANEPAVTQLDQAGGARQC